MPTTYAIPDGRTVMAATLYTGNGGTQSVNNAVNGVNFQPDFVWIKSRSAAYYNTLYDSVRGSGATKSIYSNTTDAEGTFSTLTNLSSFNSNGFTVGTTSSSPNTLNESGVTFVGWQWKAGGTAVSNTAGTITSQVSANTTAGFSVVTYTGSGSAATVGHGLGVAPSFVIVKFRTESENWYCYHESIGNTKAILLNTTGAATGASASYWNNTTPTSSVVSLGGTTSAPYTYVMYAFAPVAGYSAFGSYTGNGSADGPFVYTGFRPRFLMVRNPAIVANWLMFDSSRDTYNPEVLFFFANSAGAEVNSSATVALDFVSNGFKIRQTSGNINASGNALIYMAFAENPFKYANAR
jgi:hypothetical protein